MRDAHKMGELEARAILDSVKLPKGADPNLLKKLKADLSNASKTSPAAKVK